MRLKLVNGINPCFLHAATNSFIAGLDAPYGGSSPAMNELVAACKKNGLMPFNNFNRIHLCPPCNISVEDAKLGLEMLDKALSEIGKYYTGA